MSSLPTGRREPLQRPCRHPSLCTRSYLHFLQIARAYARPIPAEEIAQQLRRIDASQVPSVRGSLAADALREAIVEALNIAFLLRDLEVRPLSVTKLAAAERPAYLEHRLLFDDPWVGRLEGLFLTPKGSRPFPGILAIHGHGEGADIYRRRYHGEDYPARGYAILMLTMRVMGVGLATLVEHYVAIKLLTAGFTLMGLRVYESLLGLKYLRQSPLVSAERIGLIGHSGGSSTGNLTIRVDPGLRAYVSDWSVDYAEWIPLLRLYHCETVPALYPYAALINDLSTSPVPALRVPYKYTCGMQPIFGFFDQHLQP